MGLHVAVFGAGMVSRVHLDTLLSHPQVSAVSLAEADPLLLAQLQAAYPLKYCEQNYHILLDKKEIDIVDICLPHDLHYPVVLEAFSAGKHVILETPISNSLAEADEMIAAAEKSGKRFYVALNERFLPVHQRVKELLADGSLGQIVLASLTIAGSELERMQKPANWKGMIGRAGGGALADSGTHLVDLACDWFGEPEAVTCAMGRYVVKPVNKADDTANLTLHYPDKMVNLSLTYASAGQPWSECRHIWGESGSIHIQVESPDPIQVWHNGVQLHQTIEHKPDLWWAWSVGLGLKSALDSFAADKPFLVTPHHARQVLRIIRAAYRSAALKRQVKLEEVEQASFDIYLEEAGR
jgi:predicted dehydrogenase